MAPVEEPDRSPEPACSYWFSEEIRQEDFPWVFKRDGKAARVNVGGVGNAACGTCILPTRPGAERTKLVVIPTYTDNR